MPILIPILLSLGIFINLPYSINASFTCLNNSGPTITISGTQSSPYDKRASITEKTNINASGAIWKNVGPYPIQLGASADICFSGATVIGTYASSVSWDIMHSTAALYIQGQSFTVENYTVHNYGDGIRLRDNSDNFVIRDVHFTHIRDDCIENDYMNSGIVDHALFDGCYNAFSARASGGNTIADGSSKVWRIQHSLIRLQPMELGYKGASWVHAGFFKWDTGTTRKSPQLALVNNIFRADQNSDTVGLGLPPNKLVECSNNIMIWLGSGQYPGVLPETFNGRPCFTISNDVSIWDKAVANWGNAPQTTPSPTPTITPSSASTCPKQSYGDANCDNLIDMTDFEIFRKEYTTVLRTKRSDFDGDSTVTISDFEIWRRGYTGS